MVKITTPITSGNQPPCESFRVVAAKKIVSTVTKIAVAKIDKNQGYFQV